MSTPGFAITPPGKGFHITFENGWTVSVQWGAGSYCDNRDCALPLDMDAYKKPAPPCANAEIAAWDANGDWYQFEHDQVQGWTKPDDVLAFMFMVKNFPPVAKSGA